MISDLRTLQIEFQKRFTREPRFFRAPGRVNLIGEHTDYNGGFVLPMAIEYAATVAAAARDDRKISVRSLNLNEEGEIDLDAPAQKLRGSWLDYVDGVARVLERAENVKLRGADLLVSSTVPSGAGLSSSAALEVSVGLALTEISNQQTDKIKIALAGQAAEHEFVGANVGIMDQYISALGESGHALLIDCRSLEAEQVPLDTRDVAVVICNSNVKHELASSAYNERRRECEEGVRILRRFLPAIEQLRDVSVEDFKRYETNLPDVIKKRCRHVVGEIERTVRAAETLKKNDFARFGELMDLSHASLRDDYEVSCKELDALVEIAGESGLAFGARMTGGGFGGSTVNLVPRVRVAEFTEIVSTEYKRRANLDATVYVSGAANGAREIKNGE